MKRIFISILFFSIIFPLFSLAQTNSDFIVGPAKNEIFINPGENKAIDVLITNRLGKDADFKLSQSSLRVDKAGNLITSNDRQKFITEFPSTVNVKNGASKTISVKISAAKNIEPGSIAFGLYVEPIKSQMGDVLSHSRIAVTNIIRVNGQTIETGVFNKLYILDGKKFRTDSELPLAIDFANTGTVHLNPYGVVVIKNILGNEVSAKKIEPWYVMPDSNRTAKIDISTDKFVGRYTATVFLNRGYGDVIDEKTIAFYIIPFWLPVLSVVILAGIVFWFVRRGFFKGAVVAAILLAGVVNVHAEMSSGNYKVQFDSVNFGGGLSESSSYKQESTFGEISTGDSGSSNYNIRAGYQQMNEVYLAISSAADVTLAPNLGSITGGTANGSTAVTVTTDDAAGYSLYVNASTSPALASGADSFADYVPAGIAPDFSFVVGASQSFFGFSPEGVDTIQNFLDDGANCNSGVSNTSDSCWEGFATTTKKISESNSSNTPSGVSTSLKLRAAAGASRNQQGGNYVADVTFTAFAL